MRLTVEVRSGGSVSTPHESDPTVDKSTADCRDDTIIQWSASCLAIHPVSWNRWALSLHCLAQCYANIIHVVLSPTRFKLHDSPWLALVKCLQANKSLRGNKSIGNIPSTVATNHVHCRLARPVLASSLYGYEVCSQVLRASYYTSTPVKRWSGLRGTICLF